ncbi:FtsX-like permease family protein [Clostridium collagenovorans]|nr:FtsX-like permease family protein [Clostridium collagenovorans]
MYFKIAFGNVKKSFKDYTIYFLTLTLAVCIFYSFNSIESQKALVEMSASGKEYASMLTQIISYVSVFVAVILGSLILYANNFLIKKRNKELGIYMTLGMGKQKISRILIMETVIVGMLSLVSGLILGLITSQGLSVVVSKLFEVKMSEYNFVISIAAIGKTVLYFGIMFMLVMIFNTYVISKYKIIDLLTVGKKTEEIRFKSPFVYLIAFVLSMVSLVTAYKFIIDVGLIASDPKFLMSIILGVIGTVLFFFSLAGFMLYIVKKSKGIYFKGLNIFTIKQINSKINTNFLSMSVISLMLFLTICVLSTGFSFKSALEAGLKGATPFDASANMFINPDYKLQSIEEAFKVAGINFHEDDKIAYYNEYRDDTVISDIITLNNDVKDMYFHVSFIKVSEYNRIRELDNEEPIELQDNEVLITSNFSKVLPYIEEYMSENHSVKIKDKVYKIKNDKVIKHNLRTYYMQNNMLSIIINDDFCNGIELSSSNININFGGNDKIQRESDFISNMNRVYGDPNRDYDKVGFALGNTRTEVYGEVKGMSTTVLFVVIYLGIVFLISSMAVLALQQLSEASDSINRYVALKKLGANKKSINKTIFYQTLIYFSLPVLLAFIHSIVGIKVTNEFITMYGSTDISASSFITALIFIVVYGIYFYTTYTGYKNIVKNKIA